uniref:Uncharacterized protein n=1 Tax=Rhizophora mucronata TaxID=61149 RepID=A0A2P2JZQ5_RHIMU
MARNDYLYYMYAVVTKISTLQFTHCCTNVLCSAIQENKVQLKEKLSCS